MARQFQGVESIAIVPETVKTQLRRTMVMGLPPVDLDKPTFYFEKVAEWDSHDTAGKPYDWTAAPDSEEEPDPVKVICAYEFFSPLGRTGAQFTEVGDMFASTVIFTFLKEDFVKVFGASSVTVGPRQSIWYFRFWEPMLALDGMEVYQAHFHAEDTK